MKKRYFITTIIFCIFLSFIIFLIKNKSNNIKNEKQYVDKCINIEYEGQYIDENGDIELIIQKNNDKYDIELGIFRLMSLYDGIGEITNNGLNFEGIDPSGGKIYGIININEDKAIVKFTNSTWKYIQNGDTYTYKKIK